MTATARYFTLALCSALWTVPALAQEPGDVAGASVLQVQDAPTRSSVSLPASGTRP